VKIAGGAVNNAACALAQEYAQLVTPSGGKEVIISETGWPSAGGARGPATPSTIDAPQYFIEFTSWAIANSIPYFYFEAFDEAWKAAAEGPQGSHWGVWDADGNLKFGMQPVFQGQVSAAACNAAVAGSGTPSKVYASLEDHLIYW
jgi:Glycosyl hydrolases family 17